MKPRVTEILKATGLIDDRFYTVAGRDRGTAIHKATESMDILGLLADDFPQYAEKLKTWEAWKAETGAQIEAMEEGVETDDYIGRFDRIVTVYGSRWILDIKSGAKQPWHKVQVAAYAMATGIDRALLIYLGMGKRGREVQVEWDMPEAQAKWVWCLNKYKEMQRGSNT